MTILSLTSTGSITYNSFNITFGQLDSNGIEWVLQDIDYGGDVASTTTQNSSDHGGWASNQYLAPRVVELTFIAIAPSNFLRDTARKLVHNAIPSRNFATVVVSDEIDEITFTARRSGKIVETRTNETTVEYKVGLLAEDPRLYSTTQKTGTLVNDVAEVGIIFPVTFPITFPDNVRASSMTAVNNGSIEAPFVATITGEIESPGIRDDDNDLEITFDSLTLSGSDTLIINTLTKRSTLNGAYLPADITSNWFRLNPGNTSLKLLGTTETYAQSVITWYDAYDL